LILSLEISLEVDRKGTPTKFLGIECLFTPDFQTIELRQTTMIKALATKYNISYGATTVIGSGADLSKPLPDEKIIDASKYQQIIGSLLYIAQMTRPDILFVVTTLAKRNSSASERHWNAAIRVLRYLFHTSDICHQITASEIKPVIWVDASYGGDQEAGRSHTGTVTCIGENAIGWSSRRQDIVAISTTEAEYIALTCGAQEAVWIKALLNELGIDTVPMVMTDNDGAKKLAQNPGFHRRTKHINIRYHYIRNQLSQGELTVNWIPGGRNKADMLTKALVGSKLVNAVGSVLGKGMTSARGSVGKYADSIGMCEEEVNRV
jgi:hypothetical protein